MVKIIEPSYEILTDIQTLNPLKMIEIAARTCYQSWDYMKEGSAEKLVKHLVERGHTAMIEHGGLITVRFIADRGHSHELVRHRLASFAQESTRYVNYKEGLIIIKPIKCPLSLNELNLFITNKSFEHLFKKYTFNEVSTWKMWVWNMQSIEKAYKYIISMGNKPQIARTVLPIGIKSEIIISANLTEWHHIFKMRTSKFAHPMIRTLMWALLTDLKLQIPHIFDDIIVED